MNNNLKGDIGEAKAILYFREKDYHVFGGLFGHEPFDLVVCKDDKTLRVSVKTSEKRSNQSSYEFNISINTRGGPLPFDQNSCDILFFYLMAHDKICVVDSKTVTTKMTASIRPDKVTSIEDYLRGEAIYSMITAHDQSGSNNGRSKLNESQVAQIRAKYVPRVHTAMMLAEEYKVSTAVIVNVVQNKTYCHIPEK